MEIPDDLIIYHYTTASTLKAIVQGQSLRATCLAYLNDSSEVVHGRDVMLEWCKKTLVGLEPGHVFTAVSILKLMAEEYDIRNLFGVCFSENRDQLSQWRGYANQGNGYAIGFSAQALVKFCVKVQNCNLTHVIYDKDKFQNQLDDLLPYFHYSHSDRALRDQLEGRISGLKHDGFNEEAEWRLVAPLDRNNRVDPEKFRPFDERIDVFERNGILVPYLDLHVLENKQLPITEIVIGPSVQNKNNAEFSLKLLLEQAKYNMSDLKISKSNVPFLP